MCDRSISIMWHVRGEPADLDNDIPCGIWDVTLCNLYYVSVVKLLFLDCKLLVAGRLV